MEKARKCNLRFPPLSFVIACEVDQSEDILRVITVFGGKSFCENRSEPDYAHRRNTSDPLIPPNPNEFDNAASIFASCATLGM